MKKRISAFVTVIALIVFLAACGSKENTAATMYLVKTEGTVNVDNDKGKSVELMENLGLFSGYILATQEKSYGWINMDNTKLAKMDAESKVDITQEDKMLELNVHSGNLYFNVTEPLQPDEIMNIRTSTMMVGIRGTCGWVEVTDENMMCAYLLRGKVECTVLDENGNVLTKETITEGQSALMRLEDGKASIEVTEFDTGKIPDFVKEEKPEIGASIPDPEEDAAIADADTPQVETPQEEIKQEETKQEENKQEETKQEETKQEETKQETQQAAAPQEETPQEETPQKEASNLPLAAYAGTYTVYPELAYSLDYSEYGKVLTLNADGTISGAAVDGKTPSISQGANGTITIQFKQTLVFTIYPPNCGASPDVYGNGYDASRVNLQLLDTYGGALGALYYRE